MADWKRIWVFLEAWGFDEDTTPILYTFQNFNTWNQMYKFPTTFLLSNCKDYLYSETTLKLDFC